MVTFSARNVMHLTPRVAFIFAANVAVYLTFEMAAKLPFETAEEDAACSWLYK